MSDESLAYWIAFIQQLEPLTIDEKKEKILWAWNRLAQTERFVFNKLITGGFRMGVSQQLMVKALARYAGIEESVLAHKLMGQWSPQQTTLNQLLEANDGHDTSKPYPFYLAYALEEDITTLGEPEDWFAEYKWDGIRGQVIVRNGELFVWSRGEELVTDKYPEYESLHTLLPEGTVLDGEILPYKDGRPLPFSMLQTRIGRKTLSAKILKDVPVAFVVYDILEWQHNDIREWPLAERRKTLEGLCPPDHPVLRLSPLVDFRTWPATCRSPQPGAGAVERRCDAETQKLGLSQRPPAWRLVEMEDRSRIRLMPLCSTPCGVTAAGPICIPTIRLPCGITVHSFRLPKPIAALPTKRSGR